jgi:hypothetical protein
MPDSTRSLYKIILFFFLVGEGGRMFIIALGFEAHQILAECKLQRAGSRLQFSTQLLRTEA